MMCRYLSPELLKGDTRHLDKADVFALGATLYELATGTALPSSGLQYEKIRKGKLALLPNLSTLFQSMLKVRKVPIYYVPGNLSCTHSCAMCGLSAYKHACKSKGTWGLQPRIIHRAAEGSVTVVQCDTAQVCCLQQEMQDCIPVIEDVSCHKLPPVGNLLQLCCVVTDG